MEEEKAAAYYDELTRKGEGAARFKQGLGFSSNNNSPPLGSALVSSSSFLSNFVKASNSQTNKNDTNNNKQNQQQLSRPFRANSRTNRALLLRFQLSFLRELTTDTGPQAEKEKGIESGPGGIGVEAEVGRNGGGVGVEKGGVIGGGERAGVGAGRLGGGGRGKRGGKERLDYAKFIQGYDQMTPAERVKAKMKLQLNETAKKDVAIGTGTAWERFEFDKDAPLDDEEVEAADDDAALVKHIGKSFRFSTVEAQRNEQIKVAHDEAMFGTPALLPSTVADAIAGSEPDFEDDKKESTESIPQTNLLSEKVLGKQKGSWRDRARKVMDGRSTS